jgi:hypothetical protein
MDKHQRRELVGSVAAQFDLSADVTYKDLARQVGTVWSNHTGHRVTVRFARLPNEHITGATAVLADGSFLVICVDSQGWHFRLQVLLHEFAHQLLGHKYITLDKRAGLSLLMPNVLPRMAEFIATRTEFSQAEEAEAETVADELLAALTENRLSAQPVPPGTSDNLSRLRETLEH